MTENSPHTFPIDPAYARGQRTSVAGAIVLVLVFLGLAAFIRGTATVYLLGLAAFFGLCGIPHLIRILRLSVYTIVADDDGLWEARKSKADGLVRWSQVRWMREDSTRQRCELVGEQGNPLIRLDYRLHELSLLRSWIVERAANFRRHSGDSNVFTRPKTALIFERCCLVLVAGFIACFVWAFPLLGGSCAVLLAAGLAVENGRRVRGLELTPEALILSYAWKQRSVLRSEIADIRIVNLEETNRLRVVVYLFLIGERGHIQLAGLGIEPLELYQRLTDWCASPPS